MKQIFIAFITLIVLALLSCEYDNQAVYERYLDQNTESPDIDIISFDLSEDQDTIELLYDRVYFNYKCSKKVNWVGFYLNDTLLGTVESSSGYFDLYNDFLYAGTHRLRVELFVSSETGSIADGIGAEGFLYSTKEWVIIVHETSYSSVTSTAEDGFLKLRWPKHFLDVAEYVIYRYNTEVGRTTACEFIDKGYVGEGAKYYVKYITLANGEPASYGGVNIPNEINFNFTYNADNQYAIDWSSHKYYAAVDSVILFSTDIYTPYINKRTNNFSQKNFQLPISYFGQLRKFRMVMTPKYSNPGYDPENSSYPNSAFESSIKEFMIGYPSPIFDNFFRINNNEILYHTAQYDHGSTHYNDSVFRYSFTENRIMDRYRYNPPDYTWSGDHYSNLGVSPDGTKYVSVVGSTETAIYGSTNNLSEYKIVDISSFTSSKVHIAISNTGIGIFRGSNEKYLYDFENEKLIGSVNSSWSNSDYNISPDGKYFFVNRYGTSELYSNINNAITLEKTYWSDQTPRFDYFNFMANEPNKIVCWSDDTKILNILKYPEMSVVKSFNVNEDEIFDIDYDTEKILSFSSNLLIVRSLVDGSIQHSIPVELYRVYASECYLMGNSIFYDEGARYFLN